MALDAHNYVCDTCGKPATRIGGQGDYATCDKCESRYQVAMATEFPFGQCNYCGARGYEFTYTDGTKDTDYSHDEGGCSKWTDHGDEPRCLGCGRLFRVWAHCLAGQLCQACTDARDSTPGAGSG